MTTNIILNLKAKKKKKKKKSNYCLYCHTMNHIGDY